MSSKPTFKVVPPAKVKKKTTTPFLTGESIEAAVNAQPSLFDINMDEVVHLTGGSAANGDNSDPVVMFGSAEIAMRRLISEFGFERLPLTFGEFHGLLDYCLSLDSTAGNHVPAEVRTSWQETALEVCAEYEPDKLEAAKLYCAGDRAKLLAYHREHATLIRLGKQYKQFEE
jgi:hypothetical protein